MAVVGVLLLVSVFFVAGYILRGYIEVSVLNLIEKPEKPVVSNKELNKVFKQAGWERLYDWEKY